MENVSFHTFALYMKTGGYVYLLHSVLQTPASYSAENSDITAFTVSWYLLLGKPSRYPMQWDILTKMSGVTTALVAKG